MNPSFSDLDRTWHEADDPMAGARMLAWVFLFIAVSAATVGAIGMAWWLR
jgi:hypothetical protein